MGRTQKKVICEVICWSIREREGVWIGGLEHDFTFFGAKNAGGGGVGLVTLVSVFLCFFLLILCPHLDVMRAYRRREARPCIV